jgi:flagellar protein FliO/FliZ
VTTARLGSIPAAAAALPSAAWAQSQADGAATLSSPFDVSNLLGLAGSLVLVVAAILFTGWLYARLRHLNTSASKAINVLATQPLGSKERIVLVQIGDKQMAVGMTPGSMSVLHVFDEHVIEMSESGPTSPFAVKLRRAFAGSGSK